MVVDAEAEEPPAFASLPVDLLCSVAEELDAQSLARFSAARSACCAVGHEPMRDALLQVPKRCLRAIRNLPWNPNRTHFTSAWETGTFKGCPKLLLLGNLTGVTSVPEQEALDDVTPAQHEKKLQVAMHFRTLAFISVAAVYALSTFGDHEVPPPPTHSLSPPCATVSNHPATLSVFGTHVPLGSHVVCPSRLALDLAPSNGAGRNARR